MDGSRASQGGGSTPEPSVSAEGVRSISVGRDAIVANTGDIEGDFYANVSVQFVGQSSTIGSLRQDFNGLLQLLEMDHYVGREWLRQELESMRQTQPATIYLEADPGWGKSAFAADLVTRGAVGAFVRLLGDRSSRAELLSGIAASLAIRSGSKSTDLFNPAWATPEGFREFIAQVGSTHQEQTGERLLLILDGADELADRDLAHLGLWPLPECVDLLVTYRTGWPPYAPGADIDYIRPEINTQENLRDLSKYLDGRLVSPPAQGPLARAGLSPQDAREFLLTASEGLWVYAVMALREFLRGRRFDLQTLPKGLLNFYVEILSTTRDVGGSRWSAEMLPVLAALGASREPAPLERLEILSGLPRASVLSALANDWSAVTAVLTGPGGSRRFSPFHGSLQRLLDGEWDSGGHPHSLLISEIAEASRTAHRRVSKHLINQFGGFESSLSRLANVKEFSDHERYALRHLAEHLQRSDQAQTLFSVLTLPPQILALTDAPSTAKGAWALAQAQLGTPANYLRDIRKCVACAQMGVERETAIAGNVESLGAWIGSLLILKSLLAMARNTPPSLLARLVDTGAMSADAAAGLAREVPHATQRSESLAAVANVESCEISLARTLRVEAVSAAASWESDKGFVACVRPLLPHVESDVMRAVASRPNVMLNSELTDMLDSKWRHTVFSREMRSSGNLRDDVLNVANNLTTMGAYSVQDEDLAEVFQKARCHLTELLRDLPAKYPVARLAGNAALVAAGGLDAAQVRETALELIESGLGFYVLNTAGRHLERADPELIPEVFRRFPNIQDEWAAQLGGNLGEISDTDSLAATLEPPDPRVRELVDIFLATGVLPTPSVDAGTPPTLGSDSAALNASQSVAFVSAAAFRCESSAVLDLIAYVVSEIPYQNGLLKTLVARTPVEDTAEVLDFVLALDDTVNRAIALSVIAPRLTREEAVRAQQASGMLPDYEIASKFGLALLFEMAGERKRLGGSGCLWCDPSNGRVESQHDFHREAGDYSNALLIGERVEQVAKQQGWAGQEHSIGAALLNGQFPRLKDHLGQDMPVEVDLASALMCFDESWRGLVLSQLDVAQLESAAPERLIAVAESVREAPWRAMALGAVVGYMAGMHGSIRMHLEDLLTEAFALLLDVDPWEDPDSAWRLEATERIVPALSIDQQRQLISTLSRQSYIYWVAARWAADALGLEEIQDLVKRICAPRTSAEERIWEPNAVLGALVSRLPADEWFAAVRARDRIMIPYILKVAVEVISVNQLVELIPLADDSGDEVSRALGVSYISEAFRRRNPGTVSARLADERRVQTLSVLTQDSFIGEEGPKLLLLQPSADSVPETVVLAVLKASAEWGSGLGDLVREFFSKLSVERRTRYLVYAIETLGGGDERVTAGQRGTLMKGLTTLLPTIVSIGGAPALRALAASVQVVSARPDGDGGVLRDQAGPA